jgi:glycosyltransferase involved in cell wall biosynthesis
VCNGDIYLSRTIESVLKQTCQDFEIIIIDDGSTDRTGDIGREYARVHPGRVAYLYQSNKGPGAARNAGLKVARGEYIAFIDADDLWVPSKLEKQAVVLDKRPDIGLMYTDLCFIDIHDRVDGHGILGRRPLPRGNITLFFFFRYFMVTSSVMVRTTIVRENGFFREDIRVGEDTDYLLRLSTLCTAEPLEEELVEKRYRTDSLSHLDVIVNDRNAILIFDDFLRKKPRFFARHKRVLTRIMGMRSFTLGYRAMCNGKKSFALPYLLKAMRFEPSRKAIKCIVQLAIPFSLFRLARRIVHGLNQEPNTEAAAEPRALNESVSK